MYRIGGRYGTEVAPPCPSRSITRTRDREMENAGDR